MILVPERLPGTRNQVSRTHLLCQTNPGLLNAFPRPRSDRTRRWEELHV